MVRYVHILVYIMMTFILCGVLLIQIYQKREVLPIERFVHIVIEGYVDITKCPEESEDCLVGTQTERFTAASGVIIDSGKVLTADHVCAAFIRYSEESSKITQEALNMPDTPEGFVGVILNVTTYTGTKLRAQILSRSDADDLCILTTEVESTPIRLARNYPSISEHVLNISAPKGIFTPHAAPIFEGLYIGGDVAGNMFFTITTRPGSSGSPVFNKKGELVAMIYAAHPEVENYGIAVSFKQIQKFLEKNQ